MPEPTPERFLPPTPWDREKELEEASLSRQPRAPKPIGLEPIGLDEYRERAIIEYGKAKPGDLVYGLFVETHKMTPETFVAGLRTSDNPAAEMLLIELYRAYSKVRPHL